MKQIEICQEENKILDKMHRQKVAEVEKLMETVHDLEEAVLSGGAAANVDEMKTLDRELARAKVNANVVAVVCQISAYGGSYSFSRFNGMEPLAVWCAQTKFLHGILNHYQSPMRVGLCINLNQKGQESVVQHLLIHPSWSMMVSVVPRTPTNMDEHS
ncbi:hypothetical protein IFM89_003188 [Coptis chinensis]|uniref:Uncharacterized protein n=1 Tax=Coptis chinensis TaxID=261450 RepID=A0A835H407_9MAGN|nr:hypothetical protein IFM89_003188 [Coptis chinensis]